MAAIRNMEHRSPDATPSIYFDALAATPCLPEVVEAMLPYFSQSFHNPQSAYPPAESALAAVARARDQVGRLINAPPRDLFFTSGATESNNWALRGMAMHPRRRGQHIVASAIEHLSIVHPLRTLERQGFQITWVVVDALGVIDPASVLAAIRPDTALVTLTHASAELGAIEPIDAIAAVCRERRVPLHVDAANTAGYVTLDPIGWGVDLLTISPHLFYGPAGVGALYAKRGLRLPPLLEGGTQEDGRRAGTENVPAIVGFGVAAEAALRDMHSRASRWLPLRDRLRDGLAAIPGVRITGHPTQRLPHHVSCLADGVESEAVLTDLAMRGIFAASGSACSAKAGQHSHVLEAIGIGADIRSGALVFGLMLETTAAEIDALLSALSSTLAGLRSLAPRV
ncbi:MAG: cysteine desulfurase [Dehalococcoidia bacterium]|nr:cysteine desulfurase [Dehalococcoidia bacterium]